MLARSWGSASSRRWWTVPASVRNRIPWIQPPPPRNSRRFLSLPSSSSSSSSSSQTATTMTWRERMRELRHNGTPELFVGYSLLFLLGVDQYLQMRQRHSREETMQSVREELQSDKDATVRTTVQQMTQQGKVSPTLFRCIVRRVPEFFDGPLCLTSVVVGDVVDILEEGIGPGGGYNLCRIVKSSSASNDRLVFVGWFPIMCLEKVSADEKAKTKSRKEG